MSQPGRPPHARRYSASAYAPGRSAPWPEVEGGVQRHFRHRPWAAIESQADVRRGSPPERARGNDHRPADDGGRLLFVMLFWFGLATSLQLWWINTPVPSLVTVVGALTAAGRAAGMVSGFALVTQILLMSRVRWLENRVGARALVAWHRRLGAVLVTSVLAHMVLIVFGYSALSDEAVTKQAWTLLTTYEDMLGAFVAAGLLVVLGVSSIRAVRRALPYELWHWLHLTGYLVLLLGYGHQFAYGQEIARPGFGRWYWISLHLFALANVGWGRLVDPLRLNLRHRFHVLDVRPEGPGTVSVYIGGRRLDRLAARAGQHFRWRFLARGCWWQTHPFSLSAAPNGRWLRLTVKAVGNHTKDLQYLDRGVRVLAHGPFGVFTADHRVRPQALLIAGGSGIAPVRALLEDLPAGTAVIYRASTPADLVFRAELDLLARQRGAQVWYVVGGRDDAAPRRLLSARGLRELVPDVLRRDVYLCGPAGLVATAVKVLRRLGVPARQIHLDPFEL